MKYRPIIIKKGNKVRVVYACRSRRERKRLRRINRRLVRYERRLAAKYNVAEVAHGFVPGRSQVTMALLHIGYAVTLSADLHSWFDSVTYRQVRDSLLDVGMQPVHAYALANRICIPGVWPSHRYQELAPRQGLPTSPAAANMAAVVFDHRLKQRLEQLPCGWVYTRYADDLVVSLREPRCDLLLAVQKYMAETAQSMGWEIAWQKLEIQYARAGRRIIVGLSVGEHDIAAPRRIRRRLRAAINNNRNRNYITGLAQWVSCPLPKAGRPQRHFGVENRIRVPEFCRQALTRESPSSQSAQADSDTPPANVVIVNLSGGRHFGTLNNG